MVHKEWPLGSRKSVRSYTRPYFRWLLSRGCEHIHDAGVSELQEYLRFCSENMASSSLNNVKFTLKRLYAYLYQTGLAESAYDLLFSFPVRVLGKAKSAIPSEEIAVTLESVDRRTPIGKRDYAILLLGVVTGLRGIDIVKLHFSNIHWAIGEIHLCQSKTAVPLALPLTTDVGKAIEDYIRYGRPRCGQENVFVTYHTPHRELSAMVVNNIHAKYRQSAGLVRTGFHGLRRSIGKSLVTTGSPITTVAQILGHTDLVSTRQYISLDSLHLKECALCFAGIEFGGEIYEAP